MGLATILLQNRHKTLPDVIVVPEKIDRFVIFFIKYNFVGQPYKPEL